MSLQEAEAWVRTVNNGAKYVPSTTFSAKTHKLTETRLGPFHHASIEKPSQVSATTTIGFPRAYSLSLAPQLLYSRSNLLPTLVSSKVYRQLEFLAVGSWYIYQNIQKTQDEQATPDSQPSQGQSFGLYKIPGGREDIFADKNIDLRSARSLMKFLKVATDVDTHAELLSEWGLKPVSDYLSSQIGIPTKLQSLLLALTLSPNTPTETTTTFALPRIHRHLTSIGMFGPGFGSVVPRWGGLAEISQVACRAGAVGGGVYVLNKAIESISAIESTVIEASTTDVSSSKPILDVRLDNNEKVRAQWVVGTWDNLPPDSTYLGDEAPACIQRSISVISSPLSELFPTQVEGSPSLDAAVVVFPSGSLDAEAHPPVYLMVHTSSTGECPAGQCKLPFLILTVRKPHHDDPIMNYLSTLSAIPLMINLNTPLTV